jgi:hypothetical protein
VVAVVDAAVGVVVVAAAVVVVVVVVAESAVGHLWDKLESVIGMVEGSSNEAIEASDSYCYCTKHCDCRHVSLAQMEEQDLSNHCSHCPHNLVQKNWNELNLNLNYSY